ncbi:Hypothetical predicted protein [Pelobates cultripes]|uniref:Uncharacterized protein n=1 Tax=Pelobates cultripes TaxID=61616 RepID=A0AAD1R1E2_PELCU|nr:Hypothetical predicted protein [Pelobates cultripes]
MFRPLSQGGMGLPDIRGYYRAAHIAPLLSAFHHKEAMAWVEIETNYANGLSLPTMAWMPKHQRPSNKSLLPTTQLTLTIWDNYRKKMGILTKISPALPLEALGVIITDFNYKIWNKHGVRTLSQLTTDSHLKRLPDLQREFHLPATAAFPYRQLQAWSSYPTHHIKTPYEDTYPLPNNMLHDGSTSLFLPQPQQKNQRNPHPAKSPCPPLPTPPLPHSPPPPTPPKGINKNTGIPAHDILIHRPTLSRINERTQANR